MDPDASIHSPLPGAIEMGIIDVYVLYLLIYIVFSMKNQAQRAQQQNRPPSA